MKVLSYILISLFSLVILAAIISISSFPEKYFNLDTINSSSKKIQAMSRKGKNKKTIKIFIDAGHNSRTTGGFGPIGAEHTLNYEVALHLAQRLAKDKRFEYEMSRDVSNYSTNIQEFGLSNKQILNSIIATKVEGEKRSNPLSSKQYLDMYSMRHYAIDNDFDFFISIHFDTVDKKYYKNVQGFQVIVSPYNRKFDESFEMAETISKRFTEFYPVSRGTRHDKKLPESIWKKYDKNTLHLKGISLRSLIVIGDVFEYTYFNNRYSSNKGFIETIEDIPSVLLETGYLHESKFTNEATLKDVANRLYLSMCDVLL